MPSVKYKPKNSTAVTIRCSQVERGKLERLSLATGLALNEIARLIVCRVDETELLRSVVGPSTGGE
jgi:hypothetical protein